MPTRIGPGDVLWCLIEAETHVGSFSGVETYSKTSSMGRSIVTVFSTCIAHPPVCAQNQRTVILLAGEGGSISLLGVRIGVLGPVPEQSANKGERPKDQPLHEQRWPSEVDLIFEPT